MAKYIGRRRVSNYYDYNDFNEGILTQEIFDHASYYRVPGLCAAIVGEPYNDCRTKAAALAAKLGLALHIPANPKASIWYPDATFFLVFTTREHVMRWLPEQVQS